MFFSGPYQSSVRMRMQGVHGEMWPVSCGFELAGWLEVGRRGAAACACTGHAYALH